MNIREITVTTTLIITITGCAIKNIPQKTPIQSSQPASKTTALNTESPTAMPTPYVEKPEMDAYRSQIDKKTVLTINESRAPTDWKSFSNPNVSATVFYPSTWVITKQDFESVVGLTITIKNHLVIENPTLFKKVLQNGGGYREESDEFFEIEEQLTDVSIYEYAKNGATDGSPKAPTEVKHGKVLEEDSLIYTPEGQGERGNVVIFKKAGTLYHIRYPENIDKYPTIKKIMSYLKFK